MTTLRLIEANKRLMTAWMNVQYAIEDIGEIESVNDETSQAHKWMISLEQIVSVLDSTTDEIDKQIQADPEYQKQNEELAL